MDVSPSFREHADVRRPARIAVLVRTLVLGLGSLQIASCREQVAQLERGPGIAALSTAPQLGLFFFSLL